MKRAIARTLVLVAATAACASTHPVPRELAAARDAYNRAASGPSAEVSPAQLHTAKLALNKAEKWYAEAPSAQETRDFAYIAERKAQLAEAQAGIQLASQQLENAERTLQASQEQASRAAQEELRRTKEQLARAQAVNKNAERDVADKQDRADRKQDLADARDQKAKQDKEDDERGLILTLSGNVMFAAGKADLLPAARGQLDEIARALVGAKASSIAIEGFTDTRESAGRSAKLSQQRADAVLRYLASKGISGERMQAVGRGESKPLANNDNPEGRASNRRVEIVVQGSAAAQR